MRVRVTGRVQGVGFRYATRREALAGGVVGWVRNLPDGAVEVHAHGSSEAIATLLVFLHRGPRLADVASVETHAVAADPSLGTFEIR
jgi:acylphosphatase